MSVADVMTVRVVQAAPEESAREAIKKMLAANVGSIAICEGPRLVGIFTERDVLRLAGEGIDLDATLVRDVMTADPVTIQAESDVLAAARVMSERRIRHLPVVQGENILGVVGIRDVMGALVERLWREGDPDARETARELLRREVRRKSGRFARHDDFRRGLQLFGWSPRAVVSRARHVGRGDGCAASRVRLAAVTWGGSGV